MSKNIPIPDAPCRQPLSQTLNHLSHISTSASDVDDVKAGQGSKTQNPSSPLFRLSDTHRAQLQNESGISDEAIEARGYFTLTGDANGREWLQGQGFSKTQAEIGAGLVIPIRDRSGQITDYMFRPTNPRTGKNGKVTKYEKAPKSGQHIDVAPLTRDQIDDPLATLIVTEGAKKADAASTHGFAAINLNGVFAFRGTGAKGGTANLSELDEIVWKGEVAGTKIARQVLLVFDSDWLEKDGVYDALSRLTNAIERRGGQVQMVDLAPAENGAKTGLDDFFARGGTVEEFKSLACDFVTAAEREARQAQRKQFAKQKLIEDEAQTRGVPIIETAGRQLNDVLGDVSSALEQRNKQSPTLFHSPGGLATVARDAEGVARIESVGYAGLQVLAAQAAIWVHTRNGRSQSNVSPPRPLMENYLASKADWRLPVLTRVAYAPFFTENAVLCARDGYHADAGVYLQLPTDFTLSDTTPSPSNVEAARNLICDRVLEGVAFADEASRAHAIALMLQPLVRAMIKGATPLFLYEAPVQSSGKSYAARLAVWPYTRPISMIDMKNPEEWEKALFTAFLEGRSHILLDNITSKLGSPALASYLTEPYKTQRILGVNKSATVFTWNANWIGTANNAMLSADAASRIVKIRIDTKMETPEQRRYQSDPETFVQEHQAEVFSALLTLVNAWLSAGRPPFNAIKHRFSEWSRIMGGILEVCEIPGFLTNLEEERENSDPEREYWRIFVAQWFDTFGSQPVTARELLPTAHKCDEVAEMLDDKRPVQTLGTLLGKRVGQSFEADGVQGNLHIQRAKDRTRRGVLWCLARTGAGATPTPAVSAVAAGVNGVSIGAAVPTTTATASTGDASDASDATKTLPHDEENLPERSTNSEEAPACEGDVEDTSQVSPAAQVAPDMDENQSPYQGIVSCSVSMEELLN